MLWKPLINCHYIVIKPATREDSNHLISTFTIRKIAGWLIFNLISRVAAYRFCLSGNQIDDLEFKLNTSFLYFAPHFHHFTVDGGWWLRSLPEAHQVEVVKDLSGLFQTLQTLISESEGVSPLLNDQVSNISKSF